MINKKNISILTILFVLTCSVFSVQAQKKSPKDKLNVLDYYKLLPTDNNDLISSNLLEKEYTRITVEDIKNGYLKIEGAFEGWIEVALFRKKNGQAILLIGENTCGPACGTELYAFESVKGKMMNVSKKVLPKITEDDVVKQFRHVKKDPEAEMISYLYVLPQYGTTIKITNDESGELIYEIKWENDKFVIVR